MKEFPIECPGKLRLVQWWLTEKLLINRPIIASAGKNCIYVRKGHRIRPDILAHEYCHIRQMQEEGYFKFKIKYIWFNLRFGYWNNPYEIEAYEAQRKYNQ